MRPTVNSITKCSISILLITALLLSGLFIYPEKARALTVEKTVTKYHLDIGAQQVWGMGKSLSAAVWDDGIAKGGTASIKANLEFPQTVKNVKAYPYSQSAFKWGEDGFTFNENAYLKNKDNFDDNYLYYASSSISNVKASSSGTRVNLSYSVALSSITDFDLKKELNGGNLDKIFELMGGKSVVQSNYPEVYQKLVDGESQGLGNNIYGFMYFTPVIIEYDVVETVEIGELDAKLGLPNTVKQGETYYAKDLSKVSPELNVINAILEKHNGNGRWEGVTIWPGTGRKGENTGGGKSEKSEDMEAITYRLTVTAKNVNNPTKIETDTDERTVQITDGSKMEGKATLLLPEYTYEGHPALVEDASTFRVDDVQYTAKRAYKEGVARNDYVTVPYSAGTVSKSSRDDTVGTAVFPKKGNFNVRLNVELRSGVSLTDIKPIEVRKTPYIIDSLGGFQKQNRKQILTASIATYPGKPITDYYIKVRNMKTDEEIHLTKTNPQNNSAVIKTRTMKTSGDQYWTNVELEFLTKVEGEFRYTVYAIDSKGDSDIKQKIFTVRPDLPPVPSIIIEDNFIRNKGTNIAEIRVEEDTSTDGDQLLRTWWVFHKNPNEETTDDTTIKVTSNGAFQLLKDQPGFVDRSFGSGQKVKYDKTGVGKVDVKFHVKDVWNEPTLEEYIIPSDYLEGETKAQTDVLNIAPTVSVKPIITKEVDLVILANKTSMPAITSKLNTLKAAFIEGAMDPNISLVAVPEADDGTYRKVATWQWPTSVNCQICRRNEGQIDMDYAYRITSPGKVMSNYQEVCINTSPHVIEALCPGDEKCRCAVSMESETRTSVGTQHVAWSYPVNESQSFGLYLDNLERYIYVPLYDKEKTMLLNRKNGAFVAELSFVMPSTPYLTSFNENIYFADGSKIQKYDSEKNLLTTLVNQGGSVLKHLEGKIAYIGKRKDVGNLAGGGKGLFVGMFDMKTEQVKEIGIPSLEGYSGVVSGYDMDSEGKVLLGQPGKLWMVDTKTQEVKMIKDLGWGIHMNSSGFVKDETGKAVYIFHSYNSTDNKERGKFDFYLYDMKGEQPTCVASYGDRFSGWNGNGISYAKLHSRENKIYIMQGTNMQNFDMYTRPVFGFFFTINTKTMGVDKNFNNWEWDVYDETGGYNESLMKTHFAEDRWTGMTNRIKLFRNSITEEEAAISALGQKAYFSDEATEKIIAVYGKQQFHALQNNPIFNKLANEKSARLIERNTDDETDLIKNVKEKLEEEKNVLKIKGSNEGGIKLSKSFMLEPDTEYVYRYNLTSITGTAIDTFRPLMTKAEDGMVSKVLVSENYSGFSSSVRGSNEPGGGGSHGINVAYDMEEDGFIEFEYAAMANGRGTFYMSLDGRVIDTEIKEWFDFTKKASFSLAKGKHKIYFLGGVGRSEKGTMSVTNIKVYYLRTGNSKFMPNNTRVEAGKTKVIENRFRTPADGVFTILQGSEPLPMIKEKFTGNAVSLTKYLSIINAGHNRQPWGFSEANGTAVLGSGYYGPGDGYFRVQAPADKGLIFSFKENVYYPLSNSPSQGGGKMLSPTVVLLKPGETYSRSYRLNWYDNCGRNGYVILSDMMMLELDPMEHDLNRIFMKDELKNIQLTNESEPFSEIEILNDSCKTTKYINLNKNLERSSFVFDTINGDMKNFESYISNFKLHRVLQGKEQLLFQEKFNSQETFRENEWQVNLIENGYAEISAGIIPKPEIEDSPLIYKKGQLVKYNIFFDDYENDTSRKQYWRYTHTPFNDGSHPDAAKVIDQEGKEISNSGRILNSNIDRFYIDGKYTVEHWQEDNTARKDAPKGADGFPQGNPIYDKASNVEYITFYVEGGASAPWITSIKTLPKAVKEGEIFKLQIGVDDQEKDDLSLTTEVYQNKRHIYTHRQQSIEAANVGNDVKGSYPLIVTGNVPSSLGGSSYQALVGSYEVVCTVRDKTGAGLGSYKFTVVSMGKITGYVNHTDNWDQNRKKYNIKRPVVGDEETPRSKNIFWSGEKFMLEAAVASNPNVVTCQIQDYPSYKTTLKSTDRKNLKNETIYEGSIWDKTMINKWGRKAPQILTFRFTATYLGEIVKTHDVKIIIDSKTDYYRVHRLF